MASATSKAIDGLLESIEKGPQPPTQIVYVVTSYYLSNDKVELMDIFASIESARAYCQRVTEDDRPIAGVVCWRYKSNSDRHLQISSGPVRP